MSMTVTKINSCDFGAYCSGKYLRSFACVISSALHCQSGELGDRLAVYRCQLRLQLVTEKEYFAVVFVGKPFNLKMIWKFSRKQTSRRL